MRSVFVGAVLLACALSASARAGSCTDEDGDGYARGSECAGVQDCDDYNLDVNPGSVEQCNGIDDDCDGTLDEGCDGACEDSERRFGSRIIGGNDGFSQGRPRMSRALHGFGLSWANKVDEQGICQEIRFARIGDDGALLAGPVSLSHPGYDAIPAFRSDSVWTGESFFVGWTAAQGTECTDSGDNLALIERISAGGERIGKVIEPSCEIGSSLWELVWTGKYVVAMISGFSYLMRITPDGEILDPCGVLTGVAGTPSRNPLAWSGTNLSIIYLRDPDGGHNGEVFMTRFTEDLQVLDSEGIRLTDEEGPSYDPAIVWGNGEWGIAFRHDFAEFSEPDLAFLRVTSDGEVVDPPGLVHVTNDAHGDFPYNLTKVIWTGEEYGIVYQENNSAGSTGDLLLARIAADGTVLEPRRLITDDNDRKALFYDAHWNGEDYSLVWQDSSSASATRLRFDRMGCGCRDEDGDFYTSCGGNDCDDTRNDINLSAPELCGDGIDNNCDTLIDCNDTASCPVAGPVPGVVENLLAGDDGESFSWDPVMDADAYDVSRGRIVDASFEGDLRHSVCRAKGIFEPALNDPDLPPVSGGYYYLVRATAGGVDSCQLGSWGRTDRDEAIMACP